MCTYLTSTTAISGSGLGPDDWFPLASAVVYFDHPQDALVDHALCVDFRSPSGERVAVELEAESARRLALSILATLDDEEVQALYGKIKPAGAESAGRQAVVSRRTHPRPASP